MPFVATPCAADQEILPWREHYRQEMNCQIIHDSIHRRPGWTRSWLLAVDGVTAGFASMAEAGPWLGRPTLFEFHVLLEFRRHVFALFETLLAASEARFIETQSNSTLLAAMLHVWSRNVTSEKILFEDVATTALPSHAAVLRRVTTVSDDQACIARRDGSSKWVMELEGAVVGEGGIGFHYNPPYGDIYMDIVEPMRRRGLGAYFVQELKRACRELGGIPAARCDATNIASRQTCQKAGFAPCGHLLVGAIASVGT